MFIFTDENGFTVTMAFKKGAFNQKPSHVLVLCRKEQAWLLTKHKERGLECPGGKIEPDETLEAAARREAAEETGAVVDGLHFIGEYYVHDPETPFLKAVFFARVTDIEKKETYFETNGPFLETKDLLEARFEDSYSFLMKDDMIALALSEVKRKGLVE
ncbi:RNA deprotection pyrophosphohydrolase [Domibacillus indicus]|uniref:RNA deprotection pyrophosphohydrolase n=1 Tax=Domibacillus indicus TaxID=1437523 RepID=UPI0009E21711|nr:nucleoside triphosphatase YtkD [Domibacillus indicus]